MESESWREGGSEREREGESGTEKDTERMKRQIDTQSDRGRRQKEGMNEREKKRGDRD